MSRRWLVRYVVCERGRFFRESESFRWESFARMRVWLLEHLYPNVSNVEVREVD